MFPRDGEVLAGMAWCGLTPRPKQTLTLPREKKGSKGGSAARFAGIGVATAANRRRRTCEMPLTSGRSRPTDGWRRWRSSRRTWRCSETKRDAEARARRAGEALGGNGDGVSARASVRERKEKNGRALSECGAPWRPCQHRRLTSGANASVRGPSGGQVALWTFATASSSLNQATRSVSDRATSAMNNFQTRAS